MSGFVGAGFNGSAPPPPAAPSLTGPASLMDATSARPMVPVEPKEPKRHNSVKRVRAVFLSDIHLGTRACQAERLLAFLRDYESE